MTDSSQRITTSEWLILSGSGAFVVALAVSAVFVPEIRLLHVFQALIYIATAVWSVRGNRWGYFVGISGAGLWAYLGAFASSLFAQFIQQPARPDLILQMFAWVANVLVVIGSVRAYTSRSTHPGSDVVRFAVAAGLTTGYLAAAIAICDPPRLGVFPAMLHPHWPWVGP